jgi:putative ABC transport system ATP-binding protein
MTKLNAELGKTIVMVTHDPLAADFARTQIHLDKGRLVRIDERAAARS